jgi:hypothetical protein
MSDIIRKRKDAYLQIAADYYLYQLKEMRRVFEESKVEAHGSPFPRRSSDIVSGDLFDLSKLPDYQKTDSEKLEHLQQKKKEAWQVWRDFHQKTRPGHSCVTQAASRVTVS